MIEKRTEAFKSACREYLKSLDLARLRSYGRDIGVAVPTKKSKGLLIEEILAVLCEEVAPIERSKRGAPVLDDTVDPRIKARIESIRMSYLYRVVPEGKVQLDYSNADVPAYDMKAEYEKMMSNKNVLLLHDPDKEELERNVRREIRRGQLETLEEVSMLLPLDCIERDERIVVPIELIHKYGLRIGDTVSGYVKSSGNIKVVTQVLTVNEVLVENFRRNKFEECVACYPLERVRLYDEKHPSLIGKYLEWLSPIGKGQRCCVLSAPKTGKTRFLLKMTEIIKMSNSDACVLVLLVDQPPENVSLYRSVAEEDNLVYATYEDEPERQVFVADFLLKRAKRLAESGRHVFLIVDSLSALAKAYNETDASSGGKMLPCGLENKTLHYIKNYFGSARRLEKSGSLTMIGAASVDTGNPADDQISCSLKNLANFEILLSEALVTKRVYPALDLTQISSKENEALQTNEERETENLVRSEYLPRYGAVDLLNVVEKSENYHDFVRNINISLRK